MVEQDAAVVIFCGRLIDGTGGPSLEDAAVLMREGRIVAVGSSAEITQLTEVSSAERVDARDQTMLPGLVDAHVHIAWGTSDLPGWELAQRDRDLMMAWAIGSAQAALRTGVTTLRDCGAPNGITLKLKRSIGSAMIIGPRLLACGPCITTTGGHGEFMGVTADSADELRRRVRETCRGGADFIKIMATGGLMDPETNRRRAQYSESELRVAIEDAHRLGRSVVVHANATEGIRNAVAAGADTVAHCNWLGTQDGTIDYDWKVADEIAHRGVYVDLNIGGATRLLRTGDGCAQDWSAPGSPQNRWELMADMRRRGVKIFFSSDHFGPNCATYTHALIDAGERLGLTMEASIWRTTGLAAEAIGLGNQIGTIEVGKTADLLLVGGDAVTDPRALLRVRSVYLRGHLVVRDGFLAPPPLGA